METSSGSMAPTDRLVARPKFQVEVLKSSKMHDEVSCSIYNLIYTNINALQGPKPRILAVVSAEIPTIWTYIGYQWHTQRAAGGRRPRCSDHILQARIHAGRQARLLC